MYTIVYSISVYIYISLYMYNEPLDCTVSFVSIYTVDWWGMESAKPSRKSPSGRSVRCR